MIPRILHQLWFTGDPIPPNIQAWRKSWMLCNPELKLKLWNLEDILSFTMPNIMRDVLLNPNVHWVLKTDVFRYVVLFCEGGIYADTDMECLQPIEPLMEARSFAGASHVPDPVGNALIATEPENDLMLEIGKATASKILENILLANEKNVHATVRIAGTMLKGVQKIYPVEYFYPLSWQQKKNGKTAADVDLSKSYCIHHWGGLDARGWCWGTIFKDKKAMPLNKPVLSRLQTGNPIVCMQPTINRSQIIPKIIHRIWIGTQPIPKETVEYIDKQKILHPDYEHRFWTDEEIRQLHGIMFNSSWKIYKDDKINTVIKSDIIRYEILRLFGGIYFDTDVQVFRNFDEYLSLTFLCAMESKQNVGSAILGSIPYHPVSSTMLLRAANNYEKNGVPQNSYQQLIFCGPYLLTEIIKQYKIQPFPWHCFYLSRQPFLPKTIHYFYGGQSRDGWTHKLKEKNIFDKPI